MVVGFGGYAVPLDSIGGALVRDLMCADIFEVRLVGLRFEMRHFVGVIHF